MMARVVCMMLLLSATGSGALAATPDDPPQPGEPSPTATPPARSLPTLEELLGLPADERAVRDADSTIEKSRRELMRKLAPDSPSDAVSDAVMLIGQASERMQSAGDFGIATQRLQDEAVQRLDALISQAQKQQQQKQNRQRQQQQQNQQQQQQAQANQRSQQTSRAPNRGEVATPARQDGTLQAVAPGGSAAWGQLPEHVRESLVQGFSDRFSSMYQVMTESYYRRLAEQPGRATGAAPSGATGGAR